MPLIDLSGQKFGRLTVIGRAGTDKHRNALWLCKCDCGQTCIVRGDNLRNNRTTSCSCLNRERQTTHGMSYDPIYKIWLSIIDRCTNPKNKGYKRYGGRGIRIADEWRNNFQAFYDYVSTLEHFGEDGYSLDRINNDLGYMPGNLRFADRKTQNRNKRTNHLVKYQDRWITLAEASELSGIKADTLWNRIKRGVPETELFLPPDSRYSHPKKKNS